MMFTKHYQNLVYGRVEQDKDPQQKKKITMTAYQILRVKFSGQGNISSLAATKLFNIIVTKLVQANK